MVPVCPGLISLSQRGTVQPQLGLTSLISRSAFPSLATVKRYLRTVPSSTVPPSWVVSRTPITGREPAGASAEVLLARSTVGGAAAAISGDEDRMVEARKMV